MFSVAYNHNDCVFIVCVWCYLPTSRIPSTVVTFDRDIYMKGTGWYGIEVVKLDNVSFFPLLAHQQRKHVAQLSASLGAEDEPDGPLNSSRARNPSRHVTSSVCTIL